MIVKFLLFCCFFASFCLSRHFLVPHFWLHCFEKAKIVNLVILIRLNDKLFTKHTATLLIHLFKNQVSMVRNQSKNWFSSTRKLMIIRLFFQYSFYIRLLSNDCQDSSCCFEVQSKFKKVGLILSSFCMNRKRIHHFFSKITAKFFATTSNKETMLKLE